MKEKLYQLLALALKHQASDVHFTLQGNSLRVSIRTRYGMQELHSALFDLNLFNYLKYIADLDLGNCNKPQSGNFTLLYEGKSLFFRFSLIHTIEIQTAVLRILNNHETLTLQELVKDEEQRRHFYHWSNLRSGMVLFCGPTGSGKTTTLHALLSQIAQVGKHKIITLEDPIEIYDERYLQLAINEAAGFDYEEGIRQLLRHDPDVILLGEIRDAKTARMAYRCALTGHMVLSCVHAKDGTEAIKRLCELGLSRQDLQDTLTAIVAQRLFYHKQKKGERICIYEVLQGKQLHECLDEKASKHKDIYAQIKCAIKQGLVDEQEAQGDL